MNESRHSDPLDSAGPAAAVTYNLTHLDGSMVVSPSRDQFARVLDELADASDEQPDVSLSHESGWRLGIGRAWVVLENIEELAVEPRHMRSVDRDRVLQLWRALAEGDLSAVEREPWQPGYPS